jgi:glyoxylase-like metal-dependent hydrolase (beta-lactamase superfamily II)
LISGAAVGVVTALGNSVLAAGTSAIKAGDFKITTISDGHLNLPAAMFAPNVTDAERASALKAAGQSGASIVSPLNVTLIETPIERILIDVGSGGRFMDTAGKLGDGLEAAGIDPEKITKVIYTHAHPDHIWGTVNEFDELSFPNAAHYISEAEWNFWMSKDVLGKLPKDRHSFAIGAQRNLKAAKDRLNTIKPGAELIPGLNILATAGHTPGHISVEVGSGKGAVVVLGDALTHPVISFQYPQWRPASDQEPEKAVATRMRLLDKLATDGNRIIGYHLPAPGIGRVERKGSGFIFAPGS